MKLIDLTHTLSPEIPTFGGSCGFTMSLTCDYKDCTEPNLFRIQKLEMKAGLGTHMDAPAHCIEGGKSIDALALEDLVTDCVVIDASAEANENFVIMPSVIESFEKEHGTISPNAFVIFDTGWSTRWGKPKEYINDHAYPCVDPSTAQLLLERNIAGIGIDTLSADNGGKDFPVHRLILGAGKYLVENVANTHMLPPIGAKIFVLPIKIKDGTEAPIRLIASI